MREAVFRVDASQEIGAGHTMRCLTLADCLAEDGWQCTFASGPETSGIVPMIKANHGLLEIDTSDRFSLQKYRPKGADILIVDHYGLDVEFEVAYRSWAKKIFVIDDLADRQHVCDLLLDQNLGRVQNSYTHLVPQHCTVLTGPFFSLLRPQFAELREKAADRRERLSRIDRILISLGATDPHHMILPVLERVTHFAPGAQIDIALASAADHIDSITRQVAVLGKSVRLITDAHDLAEPMLEADISIGSPGTMSWERCCLGLPSLLLVTADNQRCNVAELEKAGAAIGFGDWQKPNWRVLEAALSILNDDPQKMLTMARNAFAICDGGGRVRVLDAINALF